jgi:hypothetical protein
MDRQQKELSIYWLKFMDKKKIVIVTHGFYPEQSPRAFRATELAKELCRQGHEVTVLAPERADMLPLLEAFPIQFISLGKLTWKTPNLKGIGKIGALFNKAVNRLFPLLLAFPDMELFFKIKSKIKTITKKQDLLISIAVPYPIHWGVAVVWSKDSNKNIAPKWIADCGDPYCLQENDTFQPPFYFKWVEKWFMRKADFISIPTEASIKGYFPEFHPKVKVVPQGFRFEDIEVKSMIDDGIVRFGYGGGFILGRRDPLEFLKFLSSLGKEYRFEFHVFTSQSHFIQDFAAKDSRITLHDPVNRKELLETLSSFNFVVNFANKGTAQTPSKLIDYAIINKPILQVETGKLDESSLIAFLKGNYTNQLKIENADQYRIEHVAEQFIQLATS